MENKINSDDVAVILNPGFFPSKFRFFLLIQSFSLIQEFSIQGFPHHNTCWESLWSTTMNPDCESSLMQIGSSGTWTGLDVARESPESCGCCHGDFIVVRRHEADKKKIYQKILEVGFLLKSKIGQTLAE